MRSAPLYRVAAASTARRSGSRYSLKNQSAKSLALVWLGPRTRARGDVARNGLRLPSLINEQDSIRISFGAKATATIVAAVRSRSPFRYQWVGVVQSRT